MPPGPVDDELVLVVSRRQVDDDGELCGREVAVASAVAVAVVASACSGGGRRGGGGRGGGHGDGLYPPGEGAAEVDLGERKCLEGEE